MSRISLIEQDTIEDFMFAFTKSECESLVDFIEKTFLNDIRNDTDIDSMIYVANIGAVYMKMKKSIVRGEK